MSVAERVLHANEIAESGQPTLRITVSMSASAAS